VYQILLRFVQF